MYHMEFAPFFKESVMYVEFTEYYVLSSVMGSFLLIAFLVSKNRIFWIVPNYVWFLPFNCGLVRAWGWK